MLERDTSWVGRVISWILLVPKLLEENVALKKENQKLRKDYIQSRTECRELGNELYDACQEIRLHRAEINFLAEDAKLALSKLHPGMLSEVEELKLDYLLDSLKEDTDMRRRIS